MSKVIESVRVTYPIDLVKDAIRNIALKTASRLTDHEHVFAIKYRVNRTILSVGTPATVIMELKESKKVENATVIKFTSTNMGIGPIQSGECRSKLGIVKDALLLELEELSKEGVQKPITNVPKSEPKISRPRPGKLKRKHYRADKN